MRIQSSPTLFRPQKEHWAVGDQAQQLVNFQQDHLTDTRELLGKASDIPQNGVSASYRLQRNTSLMQPARLADYALTAAKGAAIGAGVGVAGGLAMSFVAGVLEIVSLGTLTSSAPAGLLASAAVGAALGAIVGPINESEKRSDYQRYGEDLPGKLRLEMSAAGQQQLIFYPQNNLDTPVNLNRYAEAPVGTNAGPGQWWDAASPIRLS